MGQSGEDIESAILNSLTDIVSIKENILRVIHKANSSHLGSCLSVVDILTVIYSEIVDRELILSRDENRDIVIMSKGHAAAAYYAVLNKYDFISDADLEDYLEDGTHLGGHVHHLGNEFVELSTGSLGHGLPYGVGTALSQKKLNRTGRTFVVISDGECDEGTTWESALLANHFQLSNLVVVIDRNLIQSLDSTENVLALEPLASKWNSFNWNVLEVDGHSHEELTNALIAKEGPLCVIANTTKGKGVSFMEGQVLWHYKSPSKDEYDAALQEIQGQES
jgi:transketolase